MNDFLWILALCAYVCAVLVLAYALLRKGLVSSEGARKTVHILVAFTILPMVYGIHSPWLRLAGPAAFALMNGWLGKRSGERRAGLVLYPVSILIMTALMNAGVLAPLSVTAAVLAMGLGDGAAAVIGMRFGRHRIGRKTLEGSAAMLIVTAAVFSVSGMGPWYHGLLAASAVTLAEAFSPSGIDNLSVPAVAALMMEVFI